MDRQPIRINNYNNIGIENHKFRDSSCISIGLCSTIRNESYKDDFISRNKSPLRID